jgi:HAD superfamily hydrolase (TIGR01509 family)
MAVKGLIFDFDGLILDTEAPDYESWQQVYQSYGCELAIDAWGQIVGGTGASDFDPHSHLETLCGKQLDRDEIWVNRRKQYLDTITSQPVLPGVVEMLDDAKSHGLRLAVASSSPENWVRWHLARLGLYQRFDAIKTADDVKRTKPDPELYVAALAALGLQPQEAVVFEDSPNGVTAAKAAGIFCVAIPNRVTALMKLDHADLRVDSMADIPLNKLLQQVN